MRLLRQLWFVITRRRQADDLAEELEFHRDMKAAELRAAGARDADVPAGVQRALGNDLLARDRSRDVWVAPWLQDVTQDVRFGLRMIVKERRLALTAIATLGFGIGVSNAVFSFVNAAMFRGLPFESPDRLITIRTDNVRGFQAGVSYREFVEWQAQLTVVETFTSELMQSVNISDGDRAAERLSGTYVTHPTFRMLGVAPIIGRDFIADDDRDAAAPVVILSHGAWTSRYGGDPAIIGRVVKVNGEPTTVIGVMPEGFTYPLVADLWMPMAKVPGIRNATWTSTAFGAVGRLRPGVSIERARSEIETIAARTVRDHPEINKDRRVLVMGVKESSLGTGAPGLLWALLGAAVVVLCVASANVANLLLARAWNRSREIAVRVAIGAPRWRVVRQVLIECVLIGFGGTLLGAYLSFAGFHAMSSAFNVFEFGAPDRPRKPYWFDPSIDSAGWLFMVAAFLFASLATGLIPALHLSRTDANDVLKDGRDGHATLGSRRWAAALMVGQIAVALMLLSGGGLFVRYFVALYNTDPVIAVDDRVAMRLTLPAPQYATADARLQFVRRLDERLTSNPDFAESTIASELPLQMLSALSRSVTIEGDVQEPNAQPRSAVYIAAGPRFFETVKLPVIRGRSLTPADDRRGSERAVINQRFASMFFGDADPIGKRIRLTQPGPAPVPSPAWLEIVGVVPTLPDFMPNRPDDAVVYAPLLADPTPSRSVSVIVRSASKAAAVAALRHEVSRLDGDLPVYSIQTLQEALAMTRLGARLVGSWFQVLALIAVALAAVGLYALTTHHVAQRSREIGIRMALGSTASQIHWLFARQTVLLLSIGIPIGLTGALLTSRLLAPFLGDVSPRDPTTFIAVAALLSAVAIVAGDGGARRAARVDPTVVLRSD
jgi:putative ABC transport system permease protein